MSPWRRWAHRGRLTHAAVLRTCARGPSDEEGGPRDCRDHDASPGPGALSPTRLGGYQFAFNGLAETPEPASIILLGTGAAWLVVRRRKLPASAVTKQLDGL